MSYANSNRILTIGSIGSVSTATRYTVTLFSPTAPTSRESGGDLVQGDRWIDTQSFIESVYYEGTWNFINKPNFDSGIDGGGADNHDGILDLGGAVVDPLEVIYDGGNAVSN